MSYYNVVHIGCTYLPPFHTYISATGMNYRRSEESDANSHARVRTRCL